MVGIRSMPGNPYDGHTLAVTLEQVKMLAERAPTTAIVDRSYRVVEVKGVRILRSGQRRGPQPAAADEEAAAYLQLYAPATSGVGRSGAATGYGNRCARHLNKELFRMD